MVIHELKYSNTNTYLIESDKGKLLFDTGWAGTMPAFCKCMGELHMPVQDIDYLLISHFHPDHMGIAQEIANLGATIVVMDIQLPYVHTADPVFAKEAKNRFIPIEDERIKVVSTAESRGFLRSIGIEGEVFHTPGHSDDSISLWLDEGMLFVGDLNPLYELEIHKETKIDDSWKLLLALKPKMVYYGHAKTAVLDDTSKAEIKKGDLFTTVERIMKYIDKGFSIDRIQKKTGADKTLIEDVNRMYLTHQNVGVQGILDRIEIKEK